MHALGTAHHRTKGLTIVLLIKLLAIVAISALLWALQVKLEIGATAMVLLHLAPAAALVVVVLRSVMLRGRPT